MRHMPPPDSIEALRNKLRGISDWLVREKLVSSASNFVTALIPFSGISKVDFTFLREV